MSLSQIQSTYKSVGRSWFGVKVLIPVLPCIVFDKNSPDSVILCNSHSNTTASVIEFHLQVGLWLLVLSTSDVTFGTTGASVSIFTV